MVLLARLRNLGDWAAELIRARPAAATALTGALSGGIGDAVAQIYAGNYNSSRGHDGDDIVPQRPDNVKTAAAAVVESEPDPAAFSVRRTLGVAAFQAAIGPLMYLPLYAWLDRRFGARATLRSVATKVAVDDFMFVPLVEVPLFLTVTAGIEGSNARNRLVNEYRDCTLACWALNIPVTIVNFTIVPPPFRVIVLDVAECVTTCLLSFLSHRNSSSSSSSSDTGDISATTATK